MLKHGLPALPDHLKDGESVPVSWWSGPGAAAVLHLRCRPPEDDEASFTEVDVELFERSGDFWDPGPGGGAGGWEEWTLHRVDVRADHANLSGVVGGMGLIPLWGEVGTAAATVERWSRTVITCTVITTINETQVVIGGVLTEQVAATRGLLA